MVVVDSKISGMYSNTPSLSLERILVIRCKYLDSMAQEMYMDGLRCSTLQAVSMSSTILNQL